MASQSLFVRTLLLRKIVEKYDKLFGIVSNVF